VERALEEIAGEVFDETSLQQLSAELGADVDLYKEQHSRGLRYTRRQVWLWQKPRDPELCRFLHNNLGNEDGLYPLAREAGFSTSLREVRDAIAAIAREAVDFTSLDDLAMHVEFAQDLYNFQHQNGLHFSRRQVSSYEQITSVSPDLDLLAFVCEHPGGFRDLWLLGRAAGLSFSFGDLRRSLDSLLTAAFDLWSKYVEDLSIVGKDKVALAALLATDGRPCCDSRVEYVLTHMARKAATGRSDYSQLHQLWLRIPCDETELFVQQRRAGLGFKKRDVSLYCSSRRVSDRHYFILRRIIESADDAADVHAMQTSLGLCHSIETIAIVRAEVLEEARVDRVLYDHIERYGPDVNEVHSKQIPKPGCSRADVENAIRRTQRREHEHLFEAHVITGAESKDALQRVLCVEGKHNLCGVADTWYTEKRSLASLWHLSSKQQRQLRDAWLVYAGTASDLCRRLGGIYQDAEHVLVVRQWLSGAAVYLEAVRSSVCDAGPKVSTLRELSIH